MNGKHYLSYVRRRKPNRIVFANTQKDALYRDFSERKREAPSFCAVEGLPFFEKVNGWAQICKRFRITDINDEITETFLQNKQQLDTKTKTHKRPLYPKNPVSSSCLARAY